MATPRNPYVAGNPVGNSDAFVGRVDVLREVVRILRRPKDNAIVLYGQRRIGKTSILQYLAAWLPSQGPYLPVEFDLQDKATWPLGQVLQELARQVAYTLKLPDPDLGSEPETAFCQTWLPTVLDNLPDGSALVLLFDEFDVLADPQAELAAAAFFPYLRGLLASDLERLNFVFAIGRNVDDLSNIALLLFKGTDTKRISLLSRDDTTHLVRLSEANNSLHWPDETVGQVWQLTNGHPFLTQQLCSHTWERAYDEEPDRPPTATPEDVAAAVPETLEASGSTLEWLWDGLPPAERVVASALAEAGPQAISPEALERLLHDSGVRVIIRELQNAPGLLVAWDLIEPAEGGYRFRVGLLRRWITENKPLSRVQEELDRIEPVAENLYQAASGSYRGGQLDQAATFLDQALSLNPNHVGANQLRAEIHLAQGQPDEARKLLERLYEYQPAAARPRLIQALLTQTQNTKNSNEQLSLYQRVLELDPEHAEAAAGRKHVWTQRGDKALKANNLQAALTAYQEAGLADKADEVRQEMRRRELTSKLEAVKDLEHKRRYREALELARTLAKDYEELRDWSSDLDQLARKTQLSDLYQRALGALQSGDRPTAQSLLAEVVALEPGYEEATRYLHQAVTGVDIAEVQQQLEDEKTKHQKAEQRAQDLLQAQQKKPAPTIEDEKTEHQKAEQRAQDLLQTQQKRPASPPANAVSPTTPEQTSPRRLSPWNPPDYWRLLWWVLMTPQRLRAYREVFGEWDERRIGKWLVSMLTWFPLFIPTLALGVEILPHTEEAPSSAIYLCLSAGLLLAGMLTGWLGDKEKRGLAVVVAFGVAVVVAAGVAVGVAVVVAVGVAVVVAVGIADVVAFVVVIVVAAVVAVGVAVVVAAGTADVVVIVVVIIVTFGVAFGVAVVVAAGVAGGLGRGLMVFGVMGVVRESLLADHASWLGRGAFGALLLAHTFLIWFSFLGGWRLFR